MNYPITRRLTAVLLALQFAFPALAQEGADERAEVEKQLQEQLAGQVILFRHPVRGKEIRFGADGMPAPGQEAGTLVVDGNVKVATLALTGADLRFSGERIIAAVVEGKRQAISSGKKVHVVVELPPDGVAGVPGLLRRLLVPRGEDIETIPLENVTQTPDGEVLYRPSHGVTPPQLLKSVDPELNLEAKRAGFRGGVQLRIAVDSEGRVADIALLESAPYGLDEAAIRAVSEWKFKPAKRKGQPVAVAVNVDINFQVER